MVSVTLEDGTALEATYNHLFWSDAAWTPAASLEVGGPVQDSSGSLQAVKALRAYELLDTRVNNLTVEGLHTYYVGSGLGTLVHNCGPSGDGKSWDAPRSMTDESSWNGCGACALAIQEDIGGSIYILEPAFGLPRLPDYRGVLPNSGGQAPGWQKHYVVVGRDGRYYDGFTGRAGLSPEDYQRLWTSAGPRNVPVDSWDLVSMTPVDPSSVR
jgi:hypothetical protein